MDNLDEEYEDQKWQRWGVRRKDLWGNELTWIRILAFYRQREENEKYEYHLEKLYKKLGIEPDTSLLDELYHPPVEHETIPQLYEKEDPYRIETTYKIKVDGVIVRYEEDVDYIRITIEGGLPDATVNRITDDLVKKMSALENADYGREPLA